MKVRGMLVTDSRGIFDASLRSESPQKGLRSAKAGTELEDAIQELRATSGELRWVHGGAMLADSLTKKGYPARGTMELFLKVHRWRLKHDEKYESQRKRTRKGLKALEDEFDLESEPGNMNEEKVNYADGDLDETPSGSENEFEKARGELGDGLTTDMKKMQRVKNKDLARLDG
eukprot:3810829-Alexandrium_andersonii.AAC.1